jgi:hypothetical protein
MDLKSRSQEAGNRRLEGQGLVILNPKGEAESASRRTFRALCPPAGIWVRTRSFATLRMTTKIKSVIGQT